MLLSSLWPSNAALALHYVISQGESSPSSPTGHLRKHATFPSLFLSCCSCAFVGHTLLHSWSASNTSAAPLPLPPQSLSTLSLPRTVYVFVHTKSLSTVAVAFNNHPYLKKKMKRKIPPATFATISCFLTHLFDHRKEGAKGAECLLCSSLTRPPLSIHFTLPSEEEEQLRVGSLLRNFTGSTVGPLNLQPGVCLPHTLSYCTFRVRFVWKTSAALLINVHIAF